MLASQQKLIWSSVKLIDGLDDDLVESDTKYFESIAARLHVTGHKGRPNGLHVFTLQAPFMMMTLAFVAFLAGLCSVVFSPLVQLAWNDAAMVKLPNWTC